MIKKKEETSETVRSVSEASPSSSVSSASPSSSSKKVTDHPIKKDPNTGELLEEFFKYANEDTSATPEETALRLPHARLVPSAPPAGDNVPVISVDDKYMNQSFKRKLEDFQD